MSSATSGGAATSQAALRIMIIVHALREHRAVLLLMCTCRSLRDKVRSEQLPLAIDVRGDWLLSGIYEVKTKATLAGIARLAAMFPVQSLALCNTLDVSTREYDLLLFAELMEAFMQLRVEVSGPLLYTPYTSLQSLKIANFPITVRGMRALQVVVEQNPGLKRLALTRGELYGVQVSTLMSGMSEMLRKMTRLESLELPHNNIRFGPVCSILQALQFLTSLRKLNLAENNRTYDPWDLSEVGNHLAHLRDLEDLDLYWNQMGMAGATALGYALADFSRLTRLNLGANDLDFRAIGFLASCTPLTQLRELTLRENTLDFQGVVLLTDYLSALVQLRMLDLAACSINDAAAPHLRVALLPLTSLYCLTLSHNMLSDAGVSHLTCLTQLRDVELRHNRFSTGVALLCLPNIRKLDLSWTLLPYEQLQSVCSTLQDLSLCKSLRYFIWTGFAFTFEQKAALREATDRRQLSLVVVVD